jgi:hypothetical protein
MISQWVWGDAEARSAPEINLPRNRNRRHREAIDPCWVKDHPRYGRLRIYPGEGRYRLTFPSRMFVDFPDLRAAKAYADRTST